LIFFLDPGKGISRLPENGDLRPPDNRAYCVRDNCHLSLHACYQQMFLLPATSNPSYTQPGSAHAAASVCLYREQERPLRCRPIIRLHPTAGLGLPYRASGSGWRQSHPLVTHHVCVDTCALPTVLHTHLPTTSTNCPAVSDRGWDNQDGCEWVNVSSGTGLPV